MRDYVNGGMTNEESHAVEVHLNACPFCNEAIEGLFELKEGNTADAVVMLDGDFLKDHLSLHNPQIHLNSLTAAQPIQQQPYRRRRKTKSNTQPFWRNVSIAALLLLTFGSLWYYRAGNEVLQNNNPVIAEREETTLPQPTQPVPQTVQNIQPVLDTPAPVVAEAASKNIALTQPSQPAVVASNTPAIAPPVAKALAADNAGAEQKKETSKELEDVVVTAYKVPLIDRNEAASTTITSEQIEKMPSRTTEGVAKTAPGVYSSGKDDRLSIGGGRADGNLYVIDGIQVRSKTAKTDNLEKGDNLYEQKKYGAALKAYEKEMDSDDKSRRQKAAIMSARCYIDMGNKQKAIQLLQSVVDEGGPQKKAARKLLKDLRETE